MCSIDPSLISNHAWFYQLYVALIICYFVFLYFSSSELIKLSLKSETLMSYIFASIDLHFNFAFEDE